ncbi:MAG: hypothetical protein Q9228_001895 [Teloschistes exilis]
MLYHSKIALFNTSIRSGQFLAKTMDKLVIQSPIMAWYAMYSSSMKGKNATKRPIRKIVASRTFRRTMITITLIAIVLGLAYSLYPEATLAIFDAIKQLPETVRQTFQAWRYQISDVYTAGVARICQPYIAAADKVTSIYAEAVYQIYWPINFTRDLIRAVIVNIHATYRYTAY